MSISKGDSAVGKVVKTEFAGFSGIYVVYARNPEGNIIQLRMGIDLMTTTDKVV